MNSFTKTNPPHRRHPHPWRAPLALLFVLLLAAALMIVITRSARRPRPAAFPAVVATEAAREDYTAGAARAAALDAINDQREGEYGEAYDRWLWPARPPISRAGYTTLYAGCPDPLTGRKLKAAAVKARLMPPAGAVASIVLEDGTRLEHRMAWAAGWWRIALDPMAARQYAAAPPESLAKELRALGACGRPVLRAKRATPTSSPTAGKATPSTSSAPPPKTMGPAPAIQAPASIKAPAVKAPAPAAPPKRATRR